MVKPIPPSGRSKIRMFFVDADLAPGELQQLTAALSEAVRPTHIAQKSSAARLSGGTQRASADTEIEELEVEEVLDESEEEVDVVRVPSKPKKFRSPKVVHIDMKSGGKPFEDFAVEKGNPKSHQVRYLVAAYWLKNFAQIAPCTVDHIFTCYKSASGWSLDMKDPGAPLRQLKLAQDGDTKNGSFTINHAGEARVEKMKTGS